MDADLVRAVAELRSNPLTDAMVLASAWWVKSLLLVALGAAADLSARRRLPLCALSAGLGFAIASLLTTQAKDLFDRARPALGDPAALVALPTTPSFPSGHASTAFAAATAVLVWNRRLGLLALAVAVLVAFSRVYLAVHYPSDVLAGALLGAACGYLAARAVRALAERVELILTPPAAARPPAPDPAPRARPADAAAAARRRPAGRRP